MATGTKGEIGLTQIRCTTAFTMGFAGDCNRLYDIGPNLVYGLAYLKSALRACGGDRACAISRYNKGIHARPSLHSPYVRKVKKNMKAEAWIKWERKMGITITEALAEIKTISKRIEAIS